MVFMFTDNSMVEGAVGKGNTASKKLFSLVVQIKWYEMKHGYVLHVMCCSKIMMIAQGIDGFSRGALRN